MPVAMPKVGKKVYAVRNGREGPKIYQSWEEAKQNVTRFPGAVHKSFPASQVQEAEEWINVPSSLPQRIYSPWGPPPNQSSPSVKTEDTPIVLQEMLDEEMNDYGRASGGVKPELMEPEIPPFQGGQSLKPDPEDEPMGVPLDPVPPAPQPAKAPEPKIQLSSEQRAVLEMVKRGESVFFTGSAGTGKSVLLREIIRTCREDGRPGRLAITASTGIASVNIGGTTLHSWAGIGLGKEPADKLVGKLLGQDKWQRKKEKARREQMGLPPSSGRDENRAVEKWRKVRTLIIDEISMIDGVLFDKLEYIARELRNCDAPFGGIQLVLSGDFCQLPPVPDHHNGAPQPVSFAFDARSWNSCIKLPVFLTKVFRQRDQEFVDMLNAMRYGRIEPEAAHRFMSLSRAVKYTDGIEPTDLFPIRREVDSCNNRRLVALRGDLQQYEAMDTPGFDQDGRPIPMRIAEKLLERLVAPKLVELKIGAQVMLIKNQPQGHLVNGSVGRIIEFSTARDAVECGTSIASGEPGQRDTGNYRGNQGHPQVPDEIMRSKRVWPLVKFDNGSQMLCTPQVFEVNSATGAVEAARHQVPLILAWALSIHKSQGQTLQRVRVNLGRTFENGQAYVALSRATSMETLQVIGFDPLKVRAHPRVLEWISEQSGEQLVDADVDDDLEFWADL